MSAMETAMDSGGNTERDARICKRSVYRFHCVRRLPSIRAHWAGGWTLLTGATRSTGLEISTHDLWLCIPVAPQTAPTSPACQRRQRRE